MKFGLAETDDSEEGNNSSFGLLNMLLPQARNAVSSMLKSLFGVLRVNGEDGGELVLHL